MVTSPCLHHLPKSLQLHRKELFGKQSIKYQYLQTFTRVRFFTMSKTRILIVVAALALIAVGYYFRDYLTLEFLAEREVQLREYQKSNPILVLILGFILYVVVTGLSLPGATVLTLTYGWYFGFWKTLVLVSFASTAGATLAFLLSRYLFRNAIQNKFGERLKSFNENLDRDGAFYLFTLRLIPAVPFFVINVVMGLTQMKTWTYWWVSQIGMLAGTAVYVYAGSSVPMLGELAERGLSGILSPQLLVAFILLGLFPLVARKIMQYATKDKSIGESTSEKTIDSLSS